MATNDKIKNNYLQMAQNSQAGTSGYLNTQKNSIIGNLNNVLEQKYNDPRNPYYQAQQNKLQNDLYNVNQAQQQYGTLAQGLQDQQRQASLQYQQGQKYLPGQLNIQGLGSGGLSETSQVGLQNTYQNILARNQQQFGSDVNKLYQDLANTQRESDLALQQETSTLDKQNKDILAQGIANAPSQEVLDKYLKEYGEFIDPNIRIMADEKAKQFRELAEQQSLTRDYGVTDPSDFVDIETVQRSKYDFNEINNPNDPQYEIFDLLRTNGKNVIPNGTIVDINVGKGTQPMLYYNGRLYNTNSPVTKGYEGGKLYEKLGGKKEHKKD